MTGAGAPIVLVHGLGTSRESWSENLVALSGCGQVFAVDLPGFGASDAPREILSPERLAEVLMRWCLRQDLQRISLVGHSLGAEVCLWFAARYPTMAARLVLVAPTGGAPGISLGRRFWNLLRDGLREPLRMLPRLLRAYWRAGPRRMIRTARHSCSAPLRAQLACVEAECLVLWSCHDPVVSAAEAESLVRMLPHARLEVITAGAHGLIFDDPDEVNACACAFLRRP